MKKVMPYRVVLRVENYYGLIAEQAIKYWQSLPKDRKFWIDVEDFINDGLLFARHELMDQYDPRKAKFTTFLTVALKRFYLEQLIGFKRIKRVFPIGKDHELEKVQPRIFVPNTPLEIAGEVGMKKLREQASPMLKNYVDSWFYNPKGPAHIRYGVRFTKARKEFRALAPKYGVDYSTCQALLEANRRNFLTN